jgi:hypothetical protein
LQHELRDPLSCDPKFASQFGLRPALFDDRHDDASLSRLEPGEAAASDEVPQNVLFRPRLDGKSDIVIVLSVDAEWVLSLARHLKASEEGVPAEPVRDRLTAPAPGVPGEWDRVVLVLGGGVPESDSSGMEDVLGRVAPSAMSVASSRCVSHPQVVLE